MNERKTIAILGSRGIPACYGGFETFAEELAVRLARRGIDVTVFCEGSGKGRPLTYKGVRLEYVSAPKLGPLTTLLFDLRCLWRARRGFGVVYMLGYGAGAFCFLPRLWGTEVWINMDGIEWARSKWGRVARLWFKLMEALSVHAPDRLVADAESIRRHLESRHGSIKPCFVIPYGAPIIQKAPDPALLHEWGLVSGQYDLVVCRLEPENMIVEIVRGRNMSDSPYPLIIVGDHTNGSSYVRKLRSLKSEKARFIGTVYDKAKLQALRYHARAYFHGHRVGGTNPSLLEAMGCGNIIIANDNSFTHEVLGNTAFYFRNESDIPGALETIEDLNPWQIETLKDEVRIRVRDQYSWERIVNQYCALLLGINKLLIPSWLDGEGALRQSSGETTEWDASVVLKGGPARRDDGHEVPLAALHRPGNAPSLQGGRKVV